MSTKHIASIAGRRQGTKATLKSALEGGAGPVVLVLLFLASTFYVVFGGTYEVVSAPEAGASFVALALEPADAVGAPRKARLPGNAAEPIGYFPAGYVNRGRDGDGNVMTYEHD